MHCFIAFIRFVLFFASMKLLRMALGFRCYFGRNYWKFLQMISLATICCTLLVYHVSTLSTPPPKKNELCELCSENDRVIVEEDNSNRVVGDNHKSDFVKDLPPGERVDEDYNPLRRINEDETFLNNEKPSYEQLLKDVFFSIKTTKRFHESRLKPILQTWFNLAKDQTWIFSDADDPKLDKITRGHLVNTHCPSTHFRQALCCKMSVEFDFFLKMNSKWFCHFDDDQYVNVPALLDLLAQYDPREYFYLGKPSLKGPIRILDPNNKTEEISFWFATGGAGFCLSRALALRMEALASGGKFIKVCDVIQLPDDVTFGYIGHLLGQNLTVIPKFHSHFEMMKFINMKNAHSEITFSYARYAEYENILDVKGFSEEEDPTRFLSLHCLLFPNFSLCKNLPKKIYYDEDETSSLSNNIANKKRK